MDEWLAKGDEARMKPMLGFQMLPPQILTAAGERGVVVDRRESVR